MDWEYLLLTARKRADRRGCRHGPFGFQEQTMETHLQPVLIAVLVVLEVAVWQVRVALATRGRKRSAAVLGAVNAVMSVVASARW